MDNEYAGDKVVHNPLRIIYAGEINQNKNIGKLVEVVTTLNREFIPTRLEIVGELKDPSLKTILNMEYVKYNPKVDKYELIQKYRNNDIFVMISRKEAFGLVYAEAMTQGLPIIYTQDQGFDKQFDEGYVGYHVDCMNTKEIVERIITITKNYDVLSNNTRIAAKQFKWDKIALRYIELYDELVSGMDRSI